MSIHVDALRDLGGLLGEEAADEIESLEKAYELLFAEHGKLRAVLEAVYVTGPDSDGDCWIHFAPKTGKQGGFNIGRVERIGVQAALDWQAQRVEARVVTYLETATPLAEDEGAKKGEGDG